MSLDNLRRFYLKPTIALKANQKEQELRRKLFYWKYFFGTGFWI